MDEYETSHNSSLVKRLRHLYLVRRHQLESHREQRQRKRKWPSTSESEPLTDTAEFHPLEPADRSSGGSAGTAIGVKHKSETGLTPPQTPTRKRGSALLSMQPLLRPKRLTFSVWLSFTINPMLHLKSTARLYCILAAHIKPI